MSIAGSQQRTLLELLAQLRPHWRRDRNLPARIQTALARHRSFGSRDRRLYRELIYTTLRYLPWVEQAFSRDEETALQLVSWLAADSTVTERFRDTLISDWPECPVTAVAKAEILAQRFGQQEVSSPPGSWSVTSLLPEWFREHCPAVFFPQEIDALLSRAPLWIRIQTAITAPIFSEFAELGWRSTASDVLDTAWRIEDQANLTKSRAYESGQIEIQDLGSQLLLESCGIVPGGSWLDACAGAGGKTLQLAKLLGPSGEVDAFDIRTEALRELAARAARAGVKMLAAKSTNVEASPLAPRDSEMGNGFAGLRILAEPPRKTYDGVLVDAPCTGSGTWRRAPHLKWTTQPSHVEAAAARQQELLERFSERVRVGGRLLYATCSLSHCENENVIRTFLSAHPNFAFEPTARPFSGTRSDAGLTLLPSQHDTDGFFVASLRRVR